MSIYRYVHIHTHAFHPPVELRVSSVLKPCATRLANGWFIEKQSTYICVCVYVFVYR